MPAIMTDWHAKEQRLLSELSKVNYQMEALENRHRQLTRELDALAEQRRNAEAVR